MTSVVEECRITLDQRHLDGAALARMLQEAQEASERFAREGNVSVSWERLWQIEPIPFDEELIDLCDEAITRDRAASRTACPQARCTMRRKWRVPVSRR